VTAVEKRTGDCEGAYGVWTDFVTQRLSKDTGLNTTCSTGTAVCDTETIRSAVAAVLAPDAYPQDGELEEQRLLLFQHLREVIPVVEDAARRRPTESVLRAVAAAEAETARELLDAHPEPGLRAALQHVRRLARSAQSLCGHYDMLTGARPLGTA
jgi:hypothetical protein